MVVPILLLSVYINDVANIIKITYMFLLIYVFVNVIQILCHNIFKCIYLFQIGNVNSAK